MLEITVFCTFFFACFLSHSEKSNDHSEQTDSSSSEQISMNESIAQPPNDSERLTIYLEVESNTLIQDQAKLKVVFHNTSKIPIRLLDHFEPIPIFFQLNIQDVDSNLISLPGGGKIDFFSHDFNYVSLNSGQKYVHVIDLSEFLIQCEKLLPLGQIKISVTYQNQYGTDCIQGKYKSADLIVHIIE